MIKMPVGRVHSLCTPVSSPEHQSQQYFALHDSRLAGLLQQQPTSIAGVSVLMGPLLRQVPLAVLFGVFLYMGVASMSGVQLLHRFKLIFMPVKHHPDGVGYVRRVSLPLFLYTHIRTFSLLVKISLFDIMLLSNSLLRCGNLSHEIMKPY